MSNDMLEVLDANLIIIPDEPLTQIVNAMSLFEKSKLASFMRKPLTIGQGLNLDVTLGTATGTYQIESMRSQKVIVLSPLRIEVHDRSGESDFEKARIPETMEAMANALQVGPIKGLGANWQILFTLPEGISAGSVIAKKLLQQNTDFLPHNIHPIGGAVRLFLADVSSAEYTLAIEPRGQNAQTEELWMTCNASISYPENLSTELLKELFQKSYSLLFQVKDSLFSSSEL